MSTEGDLLLHIRAISPYLQPEISSSHRTFETTLTIKFGIQASLKFDPMYLDPRDAAVRIMDNLRDMATQELRIDTEAQKEVTRLRGQLNEADNKADKLLKQIEKLNGRIDAILELKK